LRFGKSDADTAGVDGDAVVNDKAGQTLRRCRAPVSIERAG